MGMKKSTITINANYCTISYSTQLWFSALHKLNNENTFSKYDNLEINGNEKCQQQEEMERQTDNVNCDRKQQRQQKIAKILQ